MRILFYSSIFPRPWKPTHGIYCYHTCRALIDLGHEVRVVSPRLWTERRSETTPLPWLSDMRPAYPMYWYTPWVLRSVFDRFMWASTRRGVRRVMDEFKPDVVLSYWAHPDGATAARFAQAAGIPSTVIVGGSDVLILPGSSRARRRSVIRALHAVNAVIAVGRVLADAVEALGVPSHKVHVVYQGIDEDRFTPGDRSDARRRLAIPLDGSVLTCVASLVPVKGIDVLLDAMALLQQRTAGVRLYFVGDGAGRRDLEARASRLALGGAVTFVGAVEQAELPDWYRAADLTVLPSRSEGVPNVLRESLTCGTPFVATRVGGVPEISDGTENRLVPPGDPVALADAIAASLAAPARAAVRHPAGTWEQCGRQIAAVLDPLVVKVASRGNVPALPRGRVDEIAIESAVESR